MAEPYMSEIRIMSFGFAPRFWAQCNGQLMSIAQNQALFSLLGTTFGGDGVSTFGLPNLMGAAPLGAGPGYTQGQTGGEATHQLGPGEIPIHTHPLNGTLNNGSIANPNQALLATFNNGYLPDQPPNQVNLDPTTLGPGGGGQPHQNMQPYLVVNVCICLAGLFPSRN